MLLGLENACLLGAYIRAHKHQIILNLHWAFKYANNMYYYTPAVYSKCICSKA